MRWSCISIEPFEIFQFTDSLAVLKKTKKENSSRWQPKRNSSNNFNPLLDYDTFCTSININTFSPLYLRYEFPFVKRARESLAEKFVATIVIYPCSTLFAKNQFSLKLLFFPPAIIRHATIRRSLISALVSSKFRLYIPWFSSAPLIDGLNELPRFAA